MTEIAVRNPGTGANDYSFMADDAQAIESKCRGLRAAQPAWSAAGLEVRAEAMRAFIAVIHTQSDDMLAALSTDTGRTNIAHVEMGGLAPMLEQMIVWAQEIEADDQEHTTFAPDIKARLQRVPYPVVGVISPWNFPLILAMIDSMPALLAGCTVALKPSEVNPRFATPLMAAAAKVEALAPVFKVIMGDGRAGATVIEHVDAVSFTGSVRTGRLVAESAGRNFIPAFLEMGGSGRRVAKRRCTGGCKNPAARQHRGNRPGMPVD